MKTFSQFVQEAVEATNKIIKLKDAKPPHMTIPANFADPTKPNKLGNTLHLFKMSKLRSKPSVRQV